MKMPHNIEKAMPHKPYRYVAYGNGVWHVYDHGNYGGWRWYAAHQNSDKSAYGDTLAMLSKQIERAIAN